MSMHVEPAIYLQLVLFPAEVTIDGLSYGDANKVILTDNHLYVIQATSEGYDIVFRTPATREEFARPTYTEYTVTTAEHTVEFTRARNCGCGSKLRSVNPFIGVPYIAQKRVGE